ncbi:hypothetical protein B481_1315 [Planococcus halocryophilus Or1]|uniref:Uncharacterized protein n=1 Tax=Planococcus halocryophilus TaxID=1215089 RepID=A0A1C7DMA6_9BACL|nr:DUF4240 domain-containing protein [Planococcus halocryophilus]ANU12646.1 hypothetical protein BBI08_01820 [Planococcus halocryophilus]EMF47153.1 hypothetical protein B481_1315 [Planococcus halocryophilus Or1]
MRRLLWDIIEESKKGKEYLPSEQQYENLIDIMNRYDKVTIEKLYEEWKNIYNQIVNDEFEKLHIDSEEGGIVEGGDDTFYQDFGHWFVAQGETVFKKYQEKGHLAMLEYIDKHHIDEEEYTFENMVYAFHDFID